MSFTPEQLASPLGRLATVIYAPDSPNPVGVAVLSSLIAQAMSRCVGNGGLTIVNQTSEWTSYNDNVLSGATFWTTGSGRLLGDLYINSDGTSSIINNGGIAKISIKQDESVYIAFENWIPETGSIEVSLTIFNYEMTKCLIELIL